MIFLVILCLLSTVAIVFGQGDLLAFGIAVAIVVLSVMIYLCWRKLKAIESKIDKSDKIDKE